MDYSALSGLRRPSGRRTSMRRAAKAMRGQVSLGMWMREGFPIGEERLGEFLETVGKISEEFGGDFAFITARAKDAGDGDELGCQGSLEVLHARRTRIQDDTKEARLARLWTKDAS